jgi:hypothetical protein
MGSSPNEFSSFSFSSRCDFYRFEKKKDAIFIGLGSFFFFWILFIRCVYYVRFSNGCLSVSFAKFMVVDELGIWSHLFMIAYINVMIYYMVKLVQILFCGFLYC